MILRATWLCLTLLALSCPGVMAEESLQQQLENRKAEFSAKAPEEVKTAYAAGIQAVADSGVLASAKHEGEKAPDFTLTNAKGESVALHDLLKKVKHASRAVVLLTDETRVRVLNDLADALAILVSKIMSEIQEMRQKSKKS